MAKVSKLVNAFGLMAGWNSFTFNFFGRDVEGLMEVSYDDNISKELIYGSGKMPIGVGEGNYEPKVKIVLRMEEVVAMTDSIPLGMRLQDATPTDAIAQYAYNARQYKDIIHNIHVTKLGRQVKQGDKVVGQELECICTHISWNI